jgi:hypothetical protein
MGLRFFRRLHIAPGIGVNLSTSGPSLTLGVRGAHVTLGSRGITRTVGLPGTGLFYTSRAGYHSGTHTAVAHPAGRALGAFAIGLVVGVGIIAAVILLIILAS